MKKRLGLAGVVVVALGTILVWRCHGEPSPKQVSAARVKSAASGAASTSAASRDRRADPRTQPRGSIAGTVIDEDRAPVPQARVCARLYSNDISSQLVRDPLCTAADDQGRYRLADLFAADYVVAASAKPYRPGVYRADGSRRRSEVELAAGEHASGIDIVLRKGGVEITGTVADISGGPIANALVTASGSWWRGDDFTPPVETDADGKFSLWVAPGDTSVQASAEGYADGSDNGKAPGTFEVLLTPESSLAGTVVDARTGAPVAGVEVELEASEWGDWSDRARDITGEDGTFRISRLAPGRYTATARSAHGYGRSDGSTLVGFGQHVDGVIVKLHAGYQVTGRVALPDKTACKNPTVTLRDSVRDHEVMSDENPDGSLHIDGVLPGTYQVSVYCEGYLPRDKYEPVAIVDKDVTDLVWPVDAGATIRGKVVTKSGAPVEGASIWARSTGGDARAKTGWGGDSSRGDGGYELTGLKAASYRIELDSDRGIAPKQGWTIAVGATSIVEQDLVLDDGGSIKGVVVDAKSQPLADVHVNAYGSSGTFRFGFSDGQRTAKDGSFAIDNLRPDTYRVVASRGQSSDTLKKPGSTDDDKQGERAIVRAGKTAAVRLVVESPTGKIAGSVIDAAGTPVSDAFVVAARESDAAGATRSGANSTRWTFRDRPQLTTTEGTFTIDKLAPGNYTIRAFRKGGGEAIVEHVAVGSTTRLQIKATGSIEGRVRRADGKLDEVQLSVEDEKTGFERQETFFRTDGVFAIRDLPAGNFVVTATADGGKKRIEIALAEGQHKTGVDITLEALVTLTGRVVDLVTKQPVPGIRMSAAIGKSSSSFAFRSDSDEELNVSGNDGRFTIEHAPTGPITVSGFPKDFGDSDYGWITATRDIKGSGTIDIGDVTVIKRRLKRGETAGELGLRFVEHPPGTERDKMSFKVSHIDAAGPAAKSGIQVGDIITTVDGIDVTGSNYFNGWLLMRAPPGTRLELGLERGIKVVIVLAAP